MFVMRTGVVPYPSYLACGSPRARRLSAILAVTGTTLELVLIPMLSASCPAVASPVADHAAAPARAPGGSARPLATGDGGRTAVPAGADVRPGSVSDDQLRR
jgi:hypothetical protein